MVEPPETKEIYGLKRQASDLLEAKDFDKLDALAKSLRDSKACYPNGEWKLFYFYEGLSLSDGATNAEWQSRLAVLRDWTKAEPDSITARVALANGLVDYAWAARGHDYADKVTDESWKLFFQRLNDAVNVLAEAKTLQQQCPCWWSALLRAELGLQVKRSQYDATFAQAIKAWPDYSGFYFLRADYLLPRWYGADGELASDLAKSADKIGGEAGDMLYAQAVWYLHHFVFSTNILEEYHLSWERTNKGLEDIERQYPDALMVKNEAAHLAVLAHDPQAAKKYFDQTKGQIDLSAWPAVEYIRFAHLVYQSQ